MNQPKVKRLLCSVLFILVSCGPRGEKGNTGLSGQSCTTSQVSNGVNVNCPGSPSVLISNGSIGLTGPSGLPGSNGLNGTVVLPVQFCPGTPVYPTVFPETGFCIDNKLYGVYSANDGFMVYLPDGDYVSNAIGSSLQLQCPRLVQ